MKINMNDVNKVCVIAEQIEKMNNSAEMEKEGITLQLFKFDTDVTNDEEMHPVVGATWGDYGYWTMFETGAFEKQYSSTSVGRETLDMISVIQDEYPYKKNADSYELTNATVRMLSNAVDFIDTLHDPSYAAAIVYDSGLYHNNIVIIRSNEDTGDTEVEVFFIDKDED